MIAPPALLLPLSGELPAECGAKAQNLARLQRLGYRVPPGVVMTDGAYRLHLREAGVDEMCGELMERLAQLDGGEIRRRCADIRKRIVETSIPHALRKELERARSALSGKLLAVRSSAACEDRKDASFAGQLESVLGVASLEQLQDAIRTVWGSLWSERSLLYARQRGLGAMHMGVVIQEQIDARFSGVLFTRNPVESSGAGEAIIEHTEGLGDGLVAGLITPNRARVRHPHLTIIRDDTGASAPALPDEMLVLLTRIGLELEQALGGPQDVEWSVDRHGLVLLQARPVTAIGPGRVVWTNANIAENFPGVVSPFLYSIVRRGYTAYFRNLGLGFGVSRRRIAAMSEVLRNIVGLQGGRLYYNLTNIHTALYLAPGGPYLARWFNQFTGAREYPKVEEIRSNAAQRFLELARVAVQTAWKYLGVRWRVARFERTVDLYARATHPQVLAAKRLPELASDLREFLEIRLNRWNDAALADAAAMVCCGALKYVLPSTEGAPKEALQGTLLSGLAGIASARPVVELWKLSRAIRRDAALRGLFSAETAENIIMRLASPGFNAFHEAFDRYLDDWGFRYSQELMLTNPTPREDPLPVIRLLQSYAREDGHGPEEISARQRAVREQLTERIAAGLTPLPWLRWLPTSKSGRFRLALRAAQGSILLRERARMKQALLYTRLRHVVLRIGEELAAQGCIDGRDAVFQLDADEVLDLIDGTLAPELARDTVLRRRKEQERFAGIEPPDSMVLARGESWRPEIAVPAGERGGAVYMLRGSSACGGQAEGFAAVVLDVREADCLRAGDILVTRQTDPGWAAVFFLVKGLIIERGGMLSHGAIIAREYGIPAVVGVPGATQLIRSGDRVRVHGDRGVVELCRG